MGGGGTLGKIAEIGTGGLVKSGETKDKIKAAEAAQAAQAALVAEEKKKVMMEEEARKKRAFQARQGRRSLLYQGGDEMGVTTQRSTTLGG